MKLWNTFHLNALICSSRCCRVASWPVCQRFSWRVAHRQHHHCCVVELNCFLAFEEVSVTDVATDVECSTAMGSIKHLLRSHNCLCWEKDSMHVRHASYSCNHELRKSQSALCTVIWKLFQTLKAGKKIPKVSLILTCPVTAIFCSQQEYSPSGLLGFLHMPQVLEPGLVGEVSCNIVHSNVTQICCHVHRRWHIIQRRMQKQGFSCFSTHSTEVILNVYAIYFNLTSSVTSCTHWDTH